MFTGYRRDDELNYLISLILLRWEDRSPVTYTKWSRGEPNNLGLNENCVYMSSITGGWLDSRCTRPLPFICKLCKLTCPSLRRVFD